MNMWKEFLPGYSVSTDGKIRNDTTGKTLTGYINNAGYRRVLLRYGKRSVHRIVAETFIANPDGKQCVNHIDGNKLNNSVDNLEWCTRSENDLHAFRTGLRSTVNKRPVYQMDNDFHVINRFDSILDASRNTGISSRNIGSVALGKRKHAGGYRWSFA